MISRGQKNHCHLGGEAVLPYMVIMKTLKNIECKVFLFSFSNVIDVAPVEGRGRIEQQEFHEKARQYR